MKKIVLLAFVLVFLSTAVVWGFMRPTVAHINESNSSYGDGKFVFASSKTIWVPDNFTSIQEAINNASDGDTIFVRAGTYYEHLVIRKSISLIGENRDKTIIDGNGTGTVVSIHHPSPVYPPPIYDLAFCQFRVQRGYCGIKMAGANNCNVTRNTIVENSDYGILLHTACNNFFRDNILMNNTRNFGIDKVGSNLLQFVQDIDSSNTVNGKPMYYLVNQRDIVINSSMTPEVGYIGIVNSANITIENFNLSGNGEGVLFAWTNNSRIIKVNVTDNQQGIILWYSNDNKLSNNIIFENCMGVELFYSHHNVLDENTVSSNFPTGLYICASHYNNVTENTISQNSYGICLGGSNNILKGNNIYSNSYNFDPCGSYFHDIDTSNRINGKPIYYWVNKHNKEIPLDAGFVAVVNCTNITVQNLNLINNHEGMLLVYTTNSTITKNNLANNWYGIWLWYSSNNSISGNNITANNWDGIILWYSANNKFYHNNLINNTHTQVYIPTSGYANFWDDGYPSGGNYWSDYPGADFQNGPHQNLTGSDGIGDTLHTLYTHNEDRFPLMGPIGFFNAGTWNETTYYVHTVSNSTFSDFYFSEDDKLVSFNVTGPDDTVGFCRVTIPNELLWCDYPEQWEVWVNNTLIEDRKIMEDTDYTYIYFTYNQSTQNVGVIGVHVIPEFPTWTSMLLIGIVLTVAIAIYKRRILKTPIH